MLLSKRGLVQVTLPFLALGALFLLSGCEKGGATGRSNQEKGGPEGSTNPGKKDTPNEPAAPAKPEEKKTDSPADPYANLHAIRPPYDELFAVSAKITLDDNQKEQLAALQKKYEPLITGKDKTHGYGQYESQARERFVRAFARQKYALLTDAQREILNIKVPVPPYAQEKGLNDPKVWDLEQLEKVFIVQSRSYDPDEQVVSFTVLSKRKLTPEEQAVDSTNWNGSAVRATFHNKHEGEIGQLNCGMYGGITRLQARRTEKDIEAGLVRYQIMIFLNNSSNWDSIKTASGVKLHYPDLK
jgi:hypothetical protein